MPKSLSDNFSSTKGNPGASEMEHSDIVFNFLLPTDEQPTEAIHPRVSPLDNPSSRSIAWDVLFGRLLFAPTANVRRIAVAVHQLAHRRVVVPLIQTHVLRLFRRWRRTLHRYRLDSGLGHLHIVTVGTVDGQANGHTMSLGQHRPLHSLLA